MPGALLDYSSEEEKKEQIPSTSLQLPECLRDKKGVAVEGIYPCQLWLEVDNLQGVFSQAQDQWEAHLHDMNTKRVAGPFHISLSRTFQLAHHQIEPFSTRLKSILLSFCTEFNLGVELCSALILPSPPSKYFLALPVSLGTQPLLDLLDHINTLLKEYGQPIYHHNPLLHVSILEVQSHSDSPLSLPCSPRFHVQQMRSLTLKTGTQVTRLSF